MSKNALYIDVDNPVSIGDLPENTLQMAWPVRTGPRLSPARFIALLAVIPPILLIGFMFSGTHAPFAISLLILVWAAALIRRFWRFSVIPHVILFAVLAFAAWFTRPYSFYFSLVYVCFLARSFCTHYTTCATASPLPVRLVKAFREKGELPPGLKLGPLVKSLADAIHHWSSYNDNRRLPGQMQSPAGRLIVRQIKTGAAVVLLVMSLPLPSPLDMLSDTIPPTAESIPFALTNISSSTLLPLVGVVLLVAFLPMTTALRKAYALKQHTTFTRYWPEFLDDLRASPDETEKASVFLGTVYADGSPVIYPANSILNMAFFGSPGSGKTGYTQFVMDMFARLGWSIICVDLKATSYELLACLMNLGRTLQIPTYHVTNQYGHASYICAPHTQSWYRNLPGIQKTDVDLASLGLIFARDYGSSYYSDAIFNLDDHMHDTYPNLENYAEHYASLQYEVANAKELSAANKRDGEHLGYCLKRLAKTDFLCPSPSTPKTALNSAVDLQSFFINQQFLYAAFPSLKLQTTSGEHARNIVAQTLHAAMSLKRQREVLLILEEFPNMLAPGLLQQMFRMARSLGIHLCLSVQSVADIYTADASFLPLLENSCTLQAWFKTTDREGIDQIQRLSGRYISHLFQETRSESRDGWVTSYGKQEAILDRFETGDILRVSSTKDAFFLRLTDNAGFAQYNGFPFVARSYRHLTTDDYDKRLDMSWPALSPQTIRVENKLPPANGNNRPQRPPQTGTIQRPKNNKRKP